MRHTFVISNVKMQWNNNTGSFISTSKIGLVNMQKKQLYKYVKWIYRIKKEKRRRPIYNIFSTKRRKRMVYFPIS
jgi:hypothetical protein